MSASSVEESMDYEDQTTSQPAEEALVTLSLTWMNSERPQKFVKSVEQLLQTWFNNSSIEIDCSLKRTLGDEQVVIQLKPAPGVAQLQKLYGQTLNAKDSKAAATISSISLTPLALRDDDASVSSPGNHPQRQKELEAVGQPGAAADSVPTPADNEAFGIVSVSQYWYLTQVYMDEMNEITKRNGVEMEENLKVSFKANENDGNPQNALSEFTSFVQSVQFSSSAVPRKFVDPDKWNKALQFAEKEDRKLLLNLTSREVVILGPTASCDTVANLLNTQPEGHTPVPISEYKKAPQDASPTITMTISDPIVETGVTIEENTWKLMNTSFIRKLENIKDKFNVCLTEAYTIPGKVTVRTSSRRPGGNASMESHSIRALLRLYQKIVTSPMNSTWSRMNQRNGGQKSEESSVDWETRGGSEAAAGLEAASDAAGGKEDNCPICFETFTEKIQLRCKHEFCKECLQKTEESTGPICPVCREVFGVIEGDQPEGTMTSSTIDMTLPGFKGFNTLQIIYKIPDGIQTNKHPNPGHRYKGITRHAYLPDNSEGQEVLHLLKKAFKRKLIFTIGTSRTTGEENSVTWNDIHHKTTTYGGPECYGYPDPDYLRRVKEELKAKGVQ